MFAIFYCLVGIILYGWALSKPCEIVHSFIQDETIARFVSRGVTEAMFNEIDVDQNGEIDHAEFLQYMLVKLRICRKEQLVKIFGMFDGTYGKL